MQNSQFSSSSFAEACVRLRLQHVEAVQVLLQASTPPSWTSRERAYLAAWASCCEDGWDEAAVALLAETVRGTSAYQEQALESTIRRRRPWVLWLLGNLATELHRPEATEHYQRALGFLNERRMDIPWLRIQVHADQARCLALQGDRAGACVAYHLARTLCTGTQAQHPALAGIDAGLCALWCTSPETLEQALVAGKRALSRLSDGKTRAEVLCHLSEASERLGQYDEALHFTERALPLSEGSNATRLAIWTAQARIRLALQDAEAAHGSCALALEVPSEEVPPETLRALYLVCARVAHAQCHQEEAISWCHKALALNPNHAEALRVFAQILEEMLMQDGQLAHTPFWREAYALLTRRS